MGNISYTAQLLAARRAVETLKSSSPVRDEFAHLFTAPEVLSRAEESKNEVHVVLMRHVLIEKYFEEKIPQVEQVVMLGAGFDTKYQRYKRCQEIKFIEVDSPEMINYKIEILNKNSLPVPQFVKKRITKKADWEMVLKQCDLNLPTLFVGEGFFMYQTFDFIRDTLKSVVKEFKKDVYWAYDLLEPRIKKTQIHQESIEKLSEKGEIFRSYLTPDESKLIAEMTGYQIDIWDTQRMHHEFFGEAYHGEIHLFVNLLERLNQ